MSLLAIAGMSEDSAHQKFRDIIWEANDGRPICPECGQTEVWVLRKERRWKCSDNSCRAQFSVTSHTVFKDRKLSFRKIPTACAVFANGVMSVAACRLSLEIDITYSSAWVLLHKVREALGLVAEKTQLGGVVEIDGAVFGGHIARLPNNRKLWDEFKRKNKAAARAKVKLIVVMRERDDPANGTIGRLRTFQLKKEGDAIVIARDVVALGTAKPSPPFPGGRGGDMPQRY